MSKRKAPIRRIELADGRVRYRFVVDVGRKADGKRDQRTMTFDTMKEARAEWARVVSETAQGVYVRPAKLTVDEWLATWLEFKASKKPTTHRFYTDVLKPVRERFGHLELQSLDERHLDMLKADMLTGRGRRRGTAGAPLSPRSVNATLNALGSALEVARKRRLVPRNVAENIDRVESDPDAGVDRGVWTTRDAVTFLRAVHTDRLRAAYLLSLLGLRRGEVLGLAWDRVDLTGSRAVERGLPESVPSIAVVVNRVVTTDPAGREIVVEGSPKGKGRRQAPYLPIPQLVVDALTTLQLRQMEESAAADEAYGSCPQCGGAHLVVDELGIPLRPQLYSDRFTANATAAGLPRLVLHGARHLAASLLADLGFTDLVIAAWLGHTEVKVTRAYTHVFAEQLAATSKALGDALAGEIQTRL